MALQVNESFTTKNGIVLPSSYIRLEVKECYCGKRAEVRYSYFADNQAFMAGFMPIVKEKRIIFSYRRDEGGSDLLTLAHNKLIEKLTTPEIEGDEPTHHPDNISIRDL